jgi:hypothetical protein
MIDYFSTIVNIQGYTIPGTGIFFDLPSVGGWFSRGIFSAIGQGMAIFLAILVVVWIGFALYGAFSIISSMGDPQKIEKGWKTIKSIWIGISYFLIFFALLGLVAVFMGIGYPWDWAENLQQCEVGGPAGGRFYFQGSYVADADDSTGFSTQPVSESLKSVMKQYPTSPRFNIICCDNAAFGPIVYAVPRTGSVPGECAVNAIIYTGNTASACGPLGEACVNNSDCCSNACVNGGGGTKYCL